MDPGTMLTVATIAQGAGAVASGIAGYQAAQGEKEAAEINSYIARTRAGQADVDARRGLEDEVGAFRAALGANGQSPSVGTFEMLRELRDVRGRERRVAVANRTQEASNFSLQAQNAQSRGNAQFVRGLTRGSRSLFDLHEMSG